ncbi:hypothetical protein OBBRIDRAFT_771410 [Obba rivulosa]|uniref:Uncharacterized protein n=1 Tax=Obba rivulosa TaxID=1052685 RepID=A0A8E2J2R6_9APHY|nr:hypothetical protein OBBRIDRAFT_771410 [Obba rivulosa]
MSPSKLKLKRTPEEQVQHDLRKARKAAHKTARRRTRDSPSPDSQSSYKRRRTHPSEHNTSWAEYEAAHYSSGDEYGPPPPDSSSSHRARKPDYDYIHAQMEEERFREKMWGALEDDERLDAVESRLNDYAHVPRRWRGGGMDRMEDDLAINPQAMEEEDYAEWVRAGMWRKKHAAEHEEQERKKAERAAQKAREEAVREETRRMERAEAEARTRRREQKQQKWRAEARARYNERWKQLLDGDTQELLFSDIPWPVLLEQPTAVSLELLTTQAIAAFLIPQDGEGKDDGRPSDVIKKARKETLRETILRFHPDKFEGRILARVRDVDRDQVREAVGIVVRAINELMTA